jgi:hypothetical protein
MKKESRALITSASNKFFPSLINLLGSIAKNYPEHPDVYVYDLGLFFTFRKELESIPWVHVLDIPHFVPHWRSCYTWKTHILNTPIADINFYLDAGNQVLRPLDSIFDEISLVGYFAVEQGVSIDRITPSNYRKVFNLPDEQYEHNSITAGIFGFKSNGPIQPVMNKLYHMGSEGLCLGYSKNEMWKSKGVNKTDIVRDCEMFRHDTTLISLLLKQEVNDLMVHEVQKYGGSISDHDDPEQYIWNMRMNYVWLPYLQSKVLHKRFRVYALLNRFIIYAFLILRQIRLIIVATTKKHFANQSN